MSLPAETERLSADLRCFFLEVFVRRHAIPLLVFLAVCAAAGVYLAPTHPSTWEASAIVRIGQTGDSTPDILAPQTVRQRVSFPGFAVQAMQSAGLSTDVSNDPNVRLIGETFRVIGKAPGTNGSLVELRAQAYNKQVVQKVMLAAIEIVQKEHEPVIASEESRLKHSLKEVEDSITVYETERRGLIARANAAGISPDKEISKGVRFSDRLQINEIDLRRLAKRREMLQDQLDPSHLFNTQAVGPVFVSARPFQSNPGLGILAGLVAGITAYVAGLLAFNGRFRRGITRAFGHRDMQLKR